MAIPKSLASWITDGRIVGTPGVKANRAIDVLGDAGFVESDDWGIVKRSWEDRDLFGYLYGSVCPTEAFDSKLVTGMRRLGLHQQALIQVRQLRMQWAEGLRLGWGLVVCGLDDSPWVRRVAWEMVSIVACDQRYDFWLSAGRPIAVPNVARLAAGAEATAEVETRYRNLIYDRGVSGHFRSHGIASSAMSNERKAFARALGVMWPWADGLRVPLGTPVQVHPLSPVVGARGLVVAIPQLGSARSGKESTAIKVKVIGSAWVRRLDAGLGGSGRVEKLAKWLAGHLASCAEGKTEFGVIEALGYRLIKGRLVGALRADWGGRLATVVLAGKVLGEDSPPIAIVVKALQRIGQPMFEAAGLLEKSEAIWTMEGFGCEFASTEHARKTGVERLALAARAKGGHWDGPKDKPQSALVLVTLGRSPRGGTVYHDFLRGRLGPDDRHFWDEVEKDGGCVVTDASSGGQRFVSLYDGLASAYLRSLGLLEDLEGPLSSLMASHNDGDAVTLIQMSTLKEAVTAASVWATRQILYEGHRWLGLSTAHRRALASAFRKFEDLLFGYPTTGVWKMNGRDVVGLSPLCAGKPLKVDTFLTALRGDDRFFGRVRREQWHQRAGGPEFPMVPPAALGPAPWFLFGPRTPMQYLKGGSFFRGAAGQWELRDGTGGAVFPGLTTEPEARAVGHIVTLLGCGALRHRRMMLATYAAQQSGGKLPLRFVPWVPLGMGEVGGYASAVMATGGMPLGTRFLAAPTEAEVKPWTWGHLRAHWTYVGRYPSLWRVRDVFDLVETMLRAREYLPKGINPITREPLEGLKAKIWSGLI